MIEKAIDKTWSGNMDQLIEAIYRQGVFQPAQPVLLQEGQRVFLRIQEIQQSNATEVHLDKKQELLRRLEEAGALEHPVSPGQGFVPFEPLVVAGEPLSETILRARR